MRYFEKMNIDVAFFITWLNKWSLSQKRISQSESHIKNNIVSLYLIMQVISAAVILLKCTYCSSNNSQIQKFLNHYFFFAYVHILLRKIKLIKLHETHCLRWMSINKSPYELNWVSHFMALVSNSGTKTHQSSCDLNLSICFYVIL